MRAFVLALLLTAGWAGLASAQSIGGNYIVRGTNPNGSTYSGTAVITPRGNVCRIAWHVGSEWQGICMMNGDAFAASYSSGSSYGLLIYRLQPDGTLTGVWTLGANSTGTETLIPMR